MHIVSSQDIVDQKKQKLMETQRNEAALITL